MQRDAFLDRIRQAARSGSAYKLDVPDVPPRAAYVGVDGDECDAMAREVDEVGGTAHLVDNLGEANERLGELLTDYAAKSTVCWQHPVLNEAGVYETLRERGIECWTYDRLEAMPAAERRERLLAADVGISSVDYAIAETGSLVVCARPGQERVASLLTPVHVAVVTRDQIVPDLFDVFGELERVKGALPSNLALITGPSKTGDIELQLTTGVHGPGKWHVIVVRAKTKAD